MAQNKLSSVALTAFQTNLSLSRKKKWMQGKKESRDSVYSLLQIGSAATKKARYWWFFIYRKAGEDDYPNFFMSIAAFVRTVKFVLLLANSVETMCVFCSFNMPDCSLFIVITIYVWFDVVLLQQ